MKPRARAIAVGRSSSLPWPAWLLFGSLAMAVAMLGAAQAAPATTSPPMNSDQGSGTATPPQKAPEIAKGSTPGVLKPKVDPDPGINVPTPNPKQFPTPVIRPPGTKGDSAQVVPK